MTKIFEGFTPQTVSFLSDIEVNNNKVWYESNKERYKKDVLLPFQNLVAQMSWEMLNIDPEFETTPAVDKTISRIYRDIRFSKDKTPYRSNVWITFKTKTTDWKNKPAFFFELFPDWYRFGMGYYTSEKNIMDRFREKIESRPAEFLMCTEFLKEKVFSVEGESYKRSIYKGKNEYIAQWYDYKFFYITCNRKKDEKLFSPELAQYLTESMKKLEPMYRYLKKI